MDVVYESTGKAADIFMHLEGRIIWLILSALLVRRFCKPRKWILRLFVKPDPNKGKEPGCFPLTLTRVPHSRKRMRLQKKVLA